VVDFTTVVGAVKEMVFVSATVDLTKQIEAPVASLREHIPTVLPVPDTERIGRTPLTLFPKLSFKLIDTVQALRPLATVGPLAEKVDLAVTGGPALKITELVLPRPAG
jgi:hypothetical protein